MINYNFFKQKPYTSYTSLANVILTFTFAICYRPAAVCLSSVCL